MSLDGGIGRRSGLKIRRHKGVRVRVPLEALARIAQLEEQQTSNL